MNFLMKKVTEFMSEFDISESALSKIIKLVTVYWTSKHFLRQARKEITYGS